MDGLSGRLGAPQRRHRDHVGWRSGPPAFLLAEAAGGPHRYAEAPLVTVGVVAGVVERRLAAGLLRCPVCSGRLVGWGHVYHRGRVIRGEGGIGWRLRPRRSRCGGCGVTHVLLPVSCLLRRADGAAVIWSALAAGAGHRKMAAALGCPASTVRSWLARFGLAGRAGPGWWFTRWLCALDADPPALAPAGSAAADAVVAVAAAAAAAGRRWVTMVGSVWPGGAGQFGERGAAAVAVVGARSVNASPG